MLYILNKYAGQHKTLFLLKTEGRTDLSYRFLNKNEKKLTQQEIARKKLNN